MCAVSGTMMLVMMAASTAVAAYGAYQSGKATEASYEAQANADKYNAEIERQNAAAARQQAGAREEAQRRQARQFLGEKRAALSQAGIGLSGSAADVYAQSAANAELDALNIRYEGEMQGRGLMAQSELSTYQGKANRMNAASAKRAGYLDAATTALSGATNAYGYYKTQPKKPKGGG